MTDVQRCDGCGTISHKYMNSYDFGHRIVDVEASPDAIDVRRTGDLCDECAREVAKLIQSLGEN